jgi:hypothetical protein
MGDKASKVMVALQTKDGLAFGYLSELSGDSVSFEVNSNISPGEEMAFRMELKGYEETVMGRLRVLAGRPGTAAAWPMYQAKILDIPDSDRALLDIWMEDMREGGSSRRVERNPEEYVRDMFAKKMSGASTASTKLVIERMNERRARRDELFKKSKDLFKQEMKLSTDSVSREAPAEASVDRDAIRGAFTRPSAPPTVDDEEDSMALFDLDDLD